MGSSLPCSLWKPASLNAGRRQEHSLFVNGMTWFLSWVEFQEEAWCHFNHWPANFLLNEHFEHTGSQEGLCLQCLETEVKDPLSQALRNKGDRLANQPLSVSKFQTMADREIQRAPQKVIKSKRPIGQEREGTEMPSKMGSVPHYGT